jgi:hypothetical protein
MLSPGFLSELDNATVIELLGHFVLTKVFRSANSAFPALTGRIDRVSRPRRGNRGNILIAADLADANRGKYKNGTVTDAGQAPAVGHGTTLSYMQDECGKGCSQKPASRA